MKIQLHLKLLILGALISSGLFSQKVDYERDTKWNIGFNMGAVFQDSDIKLQTPGFGYGFTFGRSIYERPNGFFGLDLRFRYLRGTTYGMDPNRLELDSNDTFYNQPEHNYLDSAGYTYLNNSTDLHDYSLEMVINFHRLRERTGILFHVFGGIGITDYQTKTDLLNKDGFLYDYSGLDTSGTSVSQAQKDILDGDYESNANTHDTRQIKVMPSIGFGIGYQVGPSFSIGLEHRTTFALNDVFEGYAASGSEFVNLKSGNDLYHYTGVNFRWNLFRGKYKEPAAPAETSPVSAYTACDKPTVRIINPTVNEKFETKFISVSARVSRVKSNNDVIVKVNSNSVATQYSESTQLVTANITLLNGENTIEVIASNSCGNTVKKVKVSFQEKQCLKPVVKISAPAKAVNKSYQMLMAKVIHLNGGNLSVSLNGAKVTHNYNSTSQDLTANLNLVKGNNTLVVQGSNACGDTSVTLNINFNEEPCLAPEAVILTPENGKKSKYQAATLSARIINQTDRNFISVKLNGKSLPFTFSPSSKLVSASLNLIEGTNTVEVKVTNECGVDNKTIAVVYEKEPCLAPVISVVSPQNGQTFNQSNVVFNAGVQNVTSGNQLKVLLNGNLVASSFNAFNKTVNANFNLRRGNNAIVIKATNDCGSVSEKVIVAYSCEKPAINIVSPANGLVVTNGAIQLTGSAVNLINQNQLSVKLNGQSVAFSFNNQTLAFSSAINLIDGVNILNVKATNECGEDTKEIRVTYKKPCLKPVISISSPVANQNFTSANVSLVGVVSNVSNSNQITVEQDGAPVNFALNGGNISANLLLAKGNNTITITATNSCGSVTVSIPVTYDAPCPKPSVSIVSPQNGQEFNVKSISFVANVSNIVNNSQVVIYLNGSAVAGSYNAASKTLTSTLNLIDGNNTIKVVATNDCGSDEKSINVAYKCNTPKVNFINTSNLQGVVSVANVTLTASITNVTSANQIVVKANGLVVPHNFDVNTGILTVSITLKKGANTIAVVATNSCGNDSQSIGVNYEEPCVAPVLSIASPSNGQTFTNASVSLNGSVLNITNQNQLTLKLNGVVTNVNYNPSNKTYSANLTLAEGSNSIEIKATNACGNDTKSLNVTYTKPCDKPNVVINTPSDGKEVKKAPIQLTGLVYNVTSKNQVQVLLYGVSQSFNFNPSSKTFNASLVLQEGSNVIEVKATTDCGVGSKITNVNYVACKTPRVSISTPANNKVVTQSQVSFTATVVNAIAKSEVSVEVNGAPVTFNFNVTTGVVSGVANVVDGSNTIVVIATKECGTAREEVSFVKEKCDLPVITIGDALDGTTVDNPNLTLDGYARNISSQNQMNIKLNGAGKSYNYNTKSNVYSLGLTLVEGPNTIVLTATNNCGTTTKTITVNYKPCRKPTVSLISPKDRITINEKKMSLKAVVGNVDNKNQVSLKVNGRSFPFSLSRTTLTANISGLVAGGNNILISINTPCGRVAKEAFITVKEIKPEIKISTPTKDTVTTNEKSIKIEGSVNGVFKSSDISVMVNGKTVSLSSVKPISASSFKFVGNLALVNGKNVIVIKSKNKYSFSDVKTIIVNSNQPKKIEGGKVQPVKAPTKPTRRATPGIRK